MKKLLTVLLVILGLYLLACALIPKAYEVTRETTVDASASVVYSQVIDLENWDKWSPWVEADPTIKNVYTGADQGVGQIMSWTSEESGSGTLEIIEAKENEMIRTVIDFDGQGRGNGKWTFNETENGLKVSWGMSGDTPFLMRPFNLMMDGMLGADFEKGLANLKEVAESMPAEPTVEVMSQTMPAVQYVSIKDSCSSVGDSVSAKLGTLYGEISAHLEAKGVEQAGMPFALYYTWDSVQTVFEAAIPVNQEVENGERAMYASFPACKALVAFHVGGYDTYAEHMAIEAEMSAQGVEPIGPAFEFYTNDPMEVGMENAEVTVSYPVALIEEASAE